MRDTKALHPDLQEKIILLQKKCKEAGITIMIGECLRTKAEQDALYAQGRTKPGKIVTNAKGSTYSSMHQWGVAVDFYLKMDVDGDGSASDDTFNNSTSLFNKVGKIGQSIGLVKTEYKAGQWYTVPEEIPVRNGYYGQPGKYQYLSEQLKSICNSRDGIGYVKAGKIICPVEVKTFDDGSVWFKLDATITCLAVGVDGKAYIR